MSYLFIPLPIFLLAFLINSREHCVRCSPGHAPSHLVKKDRHGWGQDQLQGGVKAGVRAGSGLVQGGLGPGWGSGRVRAGQGARLR